MLEPRGLPFSSLAKVLVFSTLRSASLSVDVPAPIMSILLLKVQSKDRRYTFPITLQPLPLASQQLTGLVDVKVKA